MSEFVELGGYIVSGDTLLNHDVSLSGNGTLESPLGLSNGGELYDTVSTNSGVWNQAINATQWNSCYGTVNTNSAAWLKNEDVLFNGTAALTATCSKSLSNYDRIRIYFNMSGVNPLPVLEFRYGSFMTCSFGIGDANVYQYFLRMTADSTHIGITNTKRVYFGGFNSTSVNITATTGNGSVHIKKIVGVK